MGSYATTAQLRIRTHIRHTPSADELTMYEELLEAASRAIDRTCGEPDDAFQIVGAPSEKYMTAFGESHLRIPLCTEVTEVAVKASRGATTYTAWMTPSSPMAGDGDWIPCRGDPADPVFETLPYNLLIVDINGQYTYFLDGGGAPVVKVTATWGTEETLVPADIREACVMQAMLWLKADQGAQADELGTEEFGRIRIQRSLSRTVRDILVDGRRIRPLYGGP